MAKNTQSDGNLALESKRCQVITIAATEAPEHVKLRVAAYVRVSSSSDDQLNSFAAQNRYYTDLIASMENWEQVDIYADEGISGTSAEKRDDFQRLLVDCRRGLIDRILVKSISRFARNTKECLETVRELKLLGVSVCFEKEHLNTAEMSGEMMTTLFAGFAQAESESISGNMRWSYQKRMQNGTFNTCCSPYGYRLIDGKLHVYEPEAQIVRLIYDLFLSGKSCEKIAEYILGIEGAAQQDRLWQHTTIRYILRNERYIGNALLQKKYTTETLPYQQKINHGEKTQYYVSGINPPIISKCKFEAVQNLIQWRAQKVTTGKRPETYLGRYLRCERCGAALRKKHIGSCTYWVCRTHDANSSKCEITQIPQEQIYLAFYRLYYKLKHNGRQILNEMLSYYTAIRSRRMLWSEDTISLNKQISDFYSQNQMLAQLRQKGLIDPDIYIQQSNELAGQLTAVKRKKEQLLEQEGDHTITQTRELLEILETGPDYLDAFDAELFDELIDRIIVESNTRIRFRLKNGLELAETIERTKR